MKYDKLLDTFLRPNVWAMFTDMHLDICINF